MLESDRSVSLLLTLTLRESGWICFQLWPL